MNMIDVISKKKQRQDLSEQEITYVINEFVKDKVPDYQMAALLMAIYFNGMSAAETAMLTMAMAHSGKVVDLSPLAGIKVDKHSTGGVADTTTLILAPLVAAAGVPVAKMSGRGLGFTGGTIDKLESIPGFRVNLSEQEFIDNLKRLNIALTGQTPSIAPADGKLYTLRDVTATVDSIPLIASSIMSKKIASGADKILLDVKTGQGAFMKDITQAIELATLMVDIGHKVGRETLAVITNMDQPLGMAIGNSLEVAEAIEVLRGNGPQNLREICLQLGSHMLVMGQVAPDFQTGYKILEHILDSGKALAKFQNFITAQGGADIINNQGVLPQASILCDIYCQQEGYIQHIDPAGLGLAAMKLGAGREFKGQAIDLSAGIVIYHKVGDQVFKGQKLLTMFSNDESKINNVKENIVLNFSIVSNISQVVKPQLIMGIVDQTGFKPFS